MNLDAVAGRAASSLREATQVDTVAALGDLRRLDAQRTVRRRAGLVGAAAVVAAIGVTQAPGAFEQDHLDPPPAPSFAQLGEAYRVIDAAVSPSGRSEAVATAREGQTDVVLVRTTEAGSPDIVWSAPASQYMGEQNVPWPTSVAWAPDGSRIAIVVALERGRTDDDPDPVDLTLLTVNPDGTDRRTIAQIGTCSCRDGLPTLTWSHDQVDVEIPDGPDRGHYTKEMP